MSDLTTHEIERSLERDRMALAQSLADLRERLSPAVLVAEGKDALIAQASPLLSRLDGAVRAQPVVAAVAGVALAALVFGRRRQVSDVEAAGAVPAMAGTRFEALTRWEDEGGPPAPEPVDPEEGWLHEAQGLQITATRLLARIDDAARRGLAPAAELAKHRAAVTAALARDTTAALGKGLGSLTGAARAQALQARERVYLSRIAVTAKGRETVESYPLATGALIAVAGAAVACLFPQTETEDQLLGEARDRLVGDLKLAAKAEVAKASDLAQGLQAALGRDIDRTRMILQPEHAWSGRGVRHH
jgi:hypothetical protein